MRSIKNINSEVWWHRQKFFKLLLLLLLITSNEQIFVSHFSNQKTRILLLFLRIARMCNLVCVSVKSTKKKIIYLSVREKKFRFRLFFLRGLSSSSASFVTSFDDNGSLLLYLPEIWGKWWLQNRFFVQARSENFRYLCRSVKIFYIHIKLRQDWKVKYEVITSVDEIFRRVLRNSYLYNCFFILKGLLKTSWNTRRTFEPVKLFREYKRFNNILFKFM